MDYNPSMLLAEKDAGQDILYEIGLLVATAAQIDFDLGGQLVRLISHETVNTLADPVVVGMDFRVKLAIIRVTANQLDTNGRDRVHKLCDKLQELYQRRNDVAHMPVIGRKGKAAYFQSYKRDAKSGEIPPPKPFTAKQIHEWSRQMEGTAIALWQCLNEHDVPDIPGPPPGFSGSASLKARMARSRSRTARTKPHKPPRTSPSPEK